MSTFWTARRPRRIGTREAEQLLTGGPVSSDRRALTEVLSTVAGPALPYEMHDRDAVMAAFAQTRRHQAPVPARAGRRRPLLPAVGRALAVKLILVLAALLVGGTAWAAGAGALPGPIQQAAHGFFSGVGVPPPDHIPPTHAATEQPTPRRSDGTAGDRPGNAEPTSGGGAENDRPPGRDEGSGRSIPAIVELCRDYLTGEERPGTSLGAAALRRLAAAADGEANIDAYCTKILAEDDKDRDDPAATPDPAPSATPPGAETGRDETDRAGRPDPDAGEDR